MPTNAENMKTPSLTDFEKRIVKRLAADGERKQDIHHLVNIGRQPTVNFGRISGSEGWAIDPATDDEIARFRYEKSLTDLRTGLSPIEHERLYRAREAMKSAVQIFNSPSIIFKTELFPVISQIAWTYLLHEYYDRKGVQIVDEQGNSLLLSQIFSREDCPLQSDVVKNLKAIKELRDKVEHRTLRSLGRNFWPLFQANCLNFDQALRKLFGENIGLNDELSVAIQFSKMDIHGLSAIQKYDINPEIEAVDQAVSAAAGEDGNESPAYKFKVNFSFDKAVKGDAHIVFTENNPNSQLAHTVLSKKVVSDELWPYKPSRVIELVCDRSGVPFNSHHHQLAWKKLGVRPRSNAKNPSDTNKKYCHYHSAHGDYTYSDEWITLLVAIVSDPQEFDELKKFMPKS